MFIRVSNFGLISKIKSCITLKKDFLEPDWKWVLLLFLDYFGVDNHCARVQCVAVLLVGLIYAKFRLWSLLP